MHIEKNGKEIEKYRRLPRLLVRGSTSEGTTTCLKGTSATADHFITDQCREQGMLLDDDSAVSKLNKLSLGVETGKNLQEAA